MKTITISNSDEESDWLKKIANGKFQQQDLQASEDAKKYRKPGIANLLDKLRKQPKND